MFAHTSLVRRAARAAATGALRASANRACVATTRAVAFRGATVACHGISTAVHACQTDTASTSGSAATAGDVIYDVDTTSFQSKVMMSDVPVLLDCYADWCGPCKQLGPILEQAVTNAGGKVHLAKLNTDANPQLAQGLRVSSLPTVLMIHQGKLVDQFVGMQPPAQVEEFVTRAAKLSAAPTQETAESLYLKGAEALDTAAAPETTPEDAAAALEAAKADFSSALERGNLAADASSGEQMTAAASYAGLVRVALAEKDDATASALVDALRSAYPSLLTVPEVSRALSMYELSKASEETEGVASLRAQLEEDADNMDARLALAKELFGGGSHGPAINECLEIVKRDNSWNEGAGRELLLQIFEVLGQSHELTVDGRKRLAGLLFR